MMWPTMCRSGTGEGDAVCDDEGSGDGGRHGEAF